MYTIEDVAKIDGRKLDHKALEHMRMLAVKRVVEDGEDPSEVMRSFGLCRTSIYPWLRKFHEEGWDALVERIAQGREPKLNDKQRQQVRRWILGKDPRQYGFEFGLWTRRIVQALIKDKMKVEFGLTAVGRLLASLDITPQKPLRRAYERDPEAVDLWLKETYPKLKKRAKALGAVIFFLDEAGFQSDPPLGADLRSQGAHPRSRNLWTTTEYQRHQRGHRAWGILGGYLYRQVECGSICCFPAKLYERPSRQSILGCGRTPGP